MLVKCQICGKKFKSLCRHVKTHDLTCAKYKLKFPKAKIISKDIHDKMVANTSGANNPMFGQKHKKKSKKAMSSKKRGRVAHNKGKKLKGKVLKNFRVAIKRRTEQLRKEGNIVSPKMKKYHERRRLIK